MHVAAVVVVVVGGAENVLGGLAKAQCVKFTPKKATSYKKNAKEYSREVRC